MPISSEWWTFSVNLIEMERDAPGVYELGNPGKNTVYIGSSDRVRSRLLEHANEPPGSCLHRFATRFRIEYTPDCEKREQDLLNEYILRHGRLPRCNDRNL
jgi:predicted GIY-YIG superfamily endonuclease